VSDTIFALATPPGRSAVAVVRISGPTTAEALAAIGAGGLEPRRASLRRLRAASGREIDQALVLWFPGPASYTGEDSAELHVHGGRAVVEALWAGLLAAGLRPAEPGEFTRRAFLNGKLDLAQAEAVADLVDAETEAQRRQALDQLDGALGRRYEAWRGELVELLALLEAEIDFPDEDLPGGLAARIVPRASVLIAELEAALAGADRGEEIREGFKIALVGAPNAGKSSLFNRLVRREAAIVTPTAGTTRDIIEAALDVKGYKVVLADMAGVRTTEHEIEAEGVRRARAWADAAALRLWVVDVSAGEGAWDEAAELVRAGDLCLANKADRDKGSDAATARAWAEAQGAVWLPVSASSGEGLDAAVAALEARVASALSGADFPAVTRARHRLRLQEARDHLQRSLGALGLGAELAAEDLRLAARALARVAGRVHAEDVLDVVFASFCIGK
jgi:tRNA modification GTPase